MSTLQALARWPVKSLGGESLTSADIDLDGLAGDRRHTVVDLHTGETPHRRQAPRDAPLDRVHVARARRDRP